MADYATLLDRIAQRAREDDPMFPLGGGLPARLSADQIALAEQRLGFRLHPLLATVYGNFANGGFGPDYAMLGLIEGKSAEQAVDLYLSFRGSTTTAWPESVLPVLAWGDGMYTCVDCASADGTVLLFEPNLDDPAESWFVDSPSLVAWFEHYIDGTGWWDKVEDGEEADMPGWTR